MEVWRESGIRNRKEIKDLVYLISLRNAIISTILLIYNQGLTVNLLFEKLLLLIDRNAHFLYFQNDPVPNQIQLDVYRINLIIFPVEGEMERWGVLDISPNPIIKSIINHFLLITSPPRPIFYR